MSQDSPDADSPTEIRQSGSSPSRPHAIESRFTPGSIIGGRYRIVTLLGEGGMGEVYRADDLKLGQRVALKYVSSKIANDPVLREHLLSEVRLGRQVSHPNVCRLYDLVEIEEMQFISMEYVEGEDLASLLRRIGRLPGDKALSIATDVCAGLAASHDRGIVHRDLKPANILIDDRGRARLTDFGLATLSEDLSQKRELVGTPAYMAPEQLDGREVTVRSDVYALGLILYEIFTGRRLFEGRTLQEIREQHTTTKTRPSSIVSDIDPAIERVILRCLEEDPAERPPSVGAVMAALPGGDPLQAAIAAGETPSPEMVAAAGRIGDLSLPVAWSSLLVFLLLLALVATLSGRYRMPAIVGGVKPDPVLAAEAHRIARLAVPEEPGDTDRIWRLDRAYESWSRKTFATGQRDVLATAPPSPMQFIYRESPGTLFPGTRTGRIGELDPPLAAAGMVNVTLDHRGNLVSFVRVPSPVKEPASGRTVDWQPWLASTGLDVAALVPVEPERNPPVAFDEQSAWALAWEVDPAVSLRIEAASLAGVPVWFELGGPWSSLAGSGGTASLGGNVIIILVAIASIAAAIFARRNLLRGRGDRRGAARLAIYLAVATFIGAISVADHVGQLAAEWQMLLVLLGASLVNGGQIWLMYMAVEPYVRRRWPQMLISLQRLLAGRFRDPMIGRDLLVGAIAGLLLRTAWLLQPFVAELLGGSALFRGVHDLVGSSTPFGLLWTVTHYQYIAVLYTLGWLVLLLLLRLIFRRLTPSLVALALVSTPSNFAGEHYLSEGLVSLSVCLLLVWVLNRFGAFALICAQVINYVSMYFYDFSDVPSVIALATLAALGIIGFILSVGHKPLFGAEAEMLSAER